MNSIRVFLDLIKTTQQSKQANNLRYLIACNLLDTENTGRVLVKEIKGTLANLFGVTERTVTNRFFKLQRLGWGSFSLKDKNTFYYKSQERIAIMLGCEYISRKAVKISLNDLKGDVVQARAFFEACTLAGEAKIIARETRRVKISGTGRRTQLKYEKINGVEKEFNYAILDDYSEHNLTKYCLLEGIEGFYFQDNKGQFGKKGKEHLARQLPNTYYSPIQVCRKYPRKNNPCVTGGRGNVDRRYFDNFEQAIKKYKDEDIVYHLTAEKDYSVRQTNYFKTIHPVEVYEK